MKKIVRTDLGDITLSRRRGLRRVTITVGRNGAVRLSVPYGVSSAYALQFLESRKQWVLAAKEKISSIAAKAVPTLPYRTKNHIIYGLGQNSKEQGLTHIAVSEDLTVEELKDLIDQVYRKEAKEYLPGRTKDIAVRHGFECGKVTVRRSMTRWGSCSSKNDISLSIYLMKLPEHLCDYIILHELCHTVHKNHGKDFHELLDRLSGGNSKILKKELKNYRPGW